VVPYEIKIADQILDNVHGYVGLTSLEKLIERLPIFKRLTDISQLGLVNRIFPCALHNRYVHSIGVMHIADQMAKKLELNDTERQLVRLAALLHDVGHYPFSHNIEKAYIENKKATVSKEEPIKIPDVLKKDYLPESNFELELGGSSLPHHEAIGEVIVKNNKILRDIIKNNFILFRNNKNELCANKFILENISVDINNLSNEIEHIVDNILDDIGGIIDGNIKKSSTFEKYALFVQIIHSELDADNIDYLMRDSTFAGTKYGAMDLGMLINALKLKCIISPKNNKYYIMGISTKGISAVEQFFINKQSAYQQVVHNKYVSILEAMLENIITWILTIKNDDDIKDVNGDVLKYKYRDIKESAKMLSDDDSFLHFTDSYMLNFINSIDVKNSNCPSITMKAIETLRKYLAFDLINDLSNLICIGTKRETLQDFFEATDLYKEVKDLNKKFHEIKDEGIYDNFYEEVFSYQFASKKLTKQLPKNDYNQITLKKKSNEFADGDDKYEAYFNYDLARLIDGIPIFDNNSKDERIEIIYNENCLDAENIPDLIVDTKCSTLCELFSLQYCILRKYKIE